LKENQYENYIGNLENKDIFVIEKFQYEGKEQEAFILTEKGKQMLE
jgi:predicted transcriptional regulator